MLLEDVNTCATIGSIPKKWTIKKLVVLIKNTFNINTCFETVRLTLKKLGFSWKKAKKVLYKTDPEKRKIFLKDLNKLLYESTRDESFLVYIDEAHIHWDTELGYGWALQKQRLYSISTSPGLSAKRSFYGIYYYNEGQVEILDFDKGNQDNTIDVLERIKRKLPSQNIKIIWDGASYHRARNVYSAAGNLGMELVQLPAYSPDFMPVEALWQWLRAEVTKNYCHKSEKGLVDRVRDFEFRINQSPKFIADRLWRTTTPLETEEKLRVLN